jgi:hypothetical protein
MHCVRVSPWRGLLLPLLLALAAPFARADACTTQAQMTPAQRNDYMRAARLLVSDVQNGDLQGLRDDTLPSVAADFTGIANSAGALRPLVQQAGLTVDALFAFEAAQPAAAAQGAQFFCSPPGSTMTIVLSFTGLPPGKYVLAIVHATGVPKPQQISLILAQGTDGQWKLAGIFSKPMMLAGRNGAWYWAQARQFAERNNAWAAYFYYQIASFLAEPNDFLTSPNVDRLRREASQVHPANLPNGQPVTVDAGGMPFQITSVDTSADLGPLDLVIRYTPTPEQAVQLRNPVQARQQVVALMTSLLAVHPGLRSAFHGLWVYAGQGNTTAFALELPMDQIPGATTQPNPSGD